MTHPPTPWQALSPEVKALALAAIRAARWVDDGPLVSGCVHDSGEAVRKAVSEAIHALRDPS